MSEELKNRTKKSAMWAFCSFLIVGISLLVSEGLGNPPIVVTMTLGIVLLISWFSIFPFSALAIYYDIKNSFHYTKKISLYVWTESTFTRGLKVLVLSLILLLMIPYLFPGHNPHSGVTLRGLLTAAGLWMALVGGLITTVVFVKYIVNMTKRTSTKISETRNERRERHILLARAEATEHEIKEEYELALVCWLNLRKYENDSALYDEDITRVKILIEKEREKGSKERAKEREKALDYDSAIEIWESLGEIDEAARVRKLKTKQGAVNVAQKVVHGDEITKTEIKDSVLNRSKVGSEGSSKAEELREAKTLLDDGIIDDDEFKQMKKEILGK